VPATRGVAARYEGVAWMATGAPHDNERLCEAAVGCKAYAGAATEGERVLVKTLGVPMRTGDCAVLQPPEGVNTVGCCTK